MTRRVTLTREEIEYCKQIGVDPYDYAREKLWGKAASSPTSGEATGSLNYYKAVTGDIDG